MKRFLSISAITLLVLAVAAAITLRVRYGGPTKPFPDYTSEPLLGSDAIEISQVQRAGKRPMTAEELQRGFALPVGTVLG